MKYAIKSKINQKFLSHLFEDEHEKMFQADEPRGVYFYNNKAIAEDIAEEENGEIVEIS